MLVEWNINIGYDAHLQDAEATHFMDILFFRKHLLVSIFLTFSFIIAHQPAFAAFFGKSKNNHWLVGGGAGGVGRSLGNSTSVNNGAPVPAPFNTDTFFIKRPNDNSLIMLFGGYQWSSLNTYIPYYSLALRYEYQPKTTVKGTVQQFGLPQFTNFHYSTKLNSSILNLVGKVNLINYHCFLPYLSVGLGIAFNHVGAYSETAIFPATARVSPDYSSKTNTNFAYSLGIGMDYIYRENVWFTLGYEYLNLGKASTGNGTGTWSNTHLDFGTLKTNTVFGTLTYLL